jgi:hypothetical protein
MGGVARPEDFDSWIAHVQTHLENECGFDVAVDAAHFGHEPVEDVIANANDIQREAVREALRVLWDTWCANQKNLIHLRR